MSTEQFLLGILVFVVIGVVLKGLRNISASPLQNAIVTFLGKPTGQVYGPGWHSFLLYPLVYGYIPVSATKVAKTFPLTVNTPDTIRLNTEVNLDFQFDKDNPIAFLESGGEAGVEKILSEIISERVREWSTSKVEGPQTWQEAREARGEAVAVLFKAILEDELEPIPSTIPTSALLRYFAEPQKPPYASETNKWGADWNKLKAKLPIDPEELKRLRKSVETRRGQIQGVRSGKGGIAKRSLGIKILRLGIGDIEVPKSIEDAAAEEPAAELKKRAEAIRNETEKANLKNLEEEVDALKARLGGDGKAALDAVLLQRNKIKREINEHKFTVDRDTIKCLGGALAVGLGKLFGGNHGQASNG